MTLFQFQLFMGDVFNFAVKVLLAFLIWLTIGAFVHWLAKVTGHPLAAISGATLTAVIALQFVFWNLGSKKV